ncbi:DUF6499 domain-containing protein [Bradyrhizobium sp. 188]|nr:DUF6499 domain-containing protein [Bradyrhizobium sp. 188]
MNVDYQRDYDAIVASSSDGEVSEEFRRRWGLCFRA